MDLENECLTSTRSKKFTLQCQIYHPDDIRSQPWVITAEQAREMRQACDKFLLSRGLKINNFNYNGKYTT